MKEQLINFETAKLAKEKGFNVETLHFYCKNRTCDYIKTPYKYSFEVNANQETLINGEIDNFGYGITWSAPTQSLLQKWLREVHGIYVNSEYDLNHDGKNIIYFSNWGFINDPSSDNYKYNPNGGYDEKAIWKTYEEALEIGLQEGLKLLSYEFY